MVQANPFSSTHMGSFEGVVGSFGRQVKPLVPFLRTTIFILSSKVTTLAFSPTALGAADIAFLIISSLSAAYAPAVPAVNRITVVIRRLVRERMTSSLKPWRTVDFLDGAKQLVWTE